MAEQIKKKPYAGKSVTEQEAKQLQAEAVKEQEKQRAARAAGEAIMHDLDDVLDEIDAVLEEEEFVQNYKQKGGE